MKLPQLSLRELFLLVALVALGCGWWADRSLLVRQQGAERSAHRHSIGRIEQQAGELGYELKFTMQSAESNPEWVLVPTGR